MVNTVDPLFIYLGTPGTAVAVIPRLQDIFSGYTVLVQITVKAL